MKNGFWRLLLFVLGALSLLLLILNGLRTLEIAEPFSICVPTADGQAIHSEIQAIAGLPAQEFTLNSSMALELDLYIQVAHTNEKRARATAAVLAFGLLTACIVALRRSFSTRAP